MYLCQRILHIQKNERNDSEQKGGGKFMEVNLRAVVVCKLLG